MTQSCFTSTEGETEARRQRVTHLRSSAKQVG